MFLRETSYDMIEIIQPTRCINFTKLLLDVYVWLKRLKLCWSCVWQVCQTTTNNASAASIQW